MEKIKLGVSECLLGHPVRYDGGHKLDRFIVDTLGQYMEFVPVCPEVECGLGVPREAMRLEGSPEAPRLVTNRTRRDLTERMLRWATKRVKQLEEEELCGFIFKSRSPSSGMERVKVYDHNGIPSNKGIGIFARIFMDHFPLIPVEDDGRLHDPKLRENFVERIFVMKRWREAMAQGMTVGRLVDFHTCHKLLIMAHSVEYYRKMGKLVAKAREIPEQELYAQYIDLLMGSLGLKASVKKNTNVLYHLMGYFKQDLSPDEKQELIDIIEHYHRGHVPLIVPVTLINHYVRKYDQPYLRDQYHLNPHPVELQLRNHV